MAVREKVQWVRPKNDQISFSNRQPLQNHWRVSLKWLPFRQGVLPIEDSSRGWRKMLVDEGGGGLDPPVQYPEMHST